MNEDLSKLTPAERLARSIAGREDCHMAMMSVANVRVVLAQLAKLEAVVGAAAVDAPTTAQDWAGLSAETAFSIIERHADTWAKGAQMMTAWADARAAVPVEATALIQNTELVLARLEQIFDRLVSCETRLLVEDAMVCARAIEARIKATNTDALKAKPTTAGIEALPLELRTVIVLHDVEGKSLQEICEAMECAIGTVRSRLARGRELLAQQVKDRSTGSGHADT